MYNMYRFWNDSKSGNIYTTNGIRNVVGDFHSDNQLCEICTMELWTLYLGLVSFKNDFPLSISRQNVTTIVKQFDHAKCSKESSLAFGPHYQEHQSEKRRGASFGFTFTNAAHICSWEFLILAQLWAFERWSIFCLVWVILLHPKWFIDFKAFVLIICQYVSIISHSGTVLCSPVHFGPVGSKMRSMLFPWKYHVCRGWAALLGRSWLVQLVVTAGTVCAYCYTAVQLANALNST